MVISSKTHSVVVEHREWMLHLRDSRQSHDITIDKKYENFQIKNYLWQTIIHFNLH